MPWFIWMCFLTAPVLVGVAYTLSSDTPYDPKQFNAVIITAGLWLFVSYHLKNYLKDATPKKWTRWWITLTIVLPLTVFFGLSLRTDPGIQKLFKRRAEASQQVDPQGLAAAAPARQALSWAETKELLARMQPHALSYSQKLLTSLPPVWWFIAFGIGLWRGKR